MELCPALLDERQLVRTGFGPSTVGALSLIAGQTNGVSHFENGTGATRPTAAPVRCRSSAIGSVPGRLLGIDHQSSRDEGREHRRPAQARRRPHVGSCGSRADFDLTRTSPNGTTGCARECVSPITQRDLAGQRDAGGLFTASPAVPVHPSRPETPGTSGPPACTRSGHSNGDRAPSSMRHRRLLRRGEGPGNFPNVSF